MIAACVCSKRPTAAEEQQRARAAGGLVLLLLPHCPNACVPSAAACPADGPTAVGNRWVGACDMRQHWQQILLTDPSLAFTTPRCRSTLDSCTCPCRMPLQAAAKQQPQQHSSRWLLLAANRGPVRSLAHASAAYCCSWSTAGGAARNTTQRAHRQPGPACCPLLRAV